MQLLHFEVDKCIVDNQCCECASRNADQDPYVTLMRIRILLFSEVIITCAHLILYGSILCHHCERPWPSMAQF
jgi:hypothetical protein